MKIFILIIGIGSGGAGFHSQQVEIIGLQNCINAKEAVKVMNYTRARCIWTGKTQQKPTTTKE